MGAPLKNQNVLQSILGSLDNFLKGVFYHPKNRGGKERGKLFSLYLPGGSVEKPCAAGVDVPSGLVLVYDEDGGEHFIDP